MEKKPPLYVKVVTGTSKNLILLINHINGYK